MELKSPTQKRKGSNLSKAPIFPIQTSDINYQSFDSYNTYDVFSGYFNGNSVIVDDPEEIKMLYTMGFYGKASLSKGFPNFGQHKKDEPMVLKEDQWIRRKQWSEKLKKIIRDLQLTKTKECENGQILESTSNTEEPTTSNSNVEHAPTNVCGEDVNNSHNGKNSAPANDEQMDTDKINTSISDAQNFPKDCYMDESREVLVISECNDVDNLLNLKAHIEVEQLKTVMEVLHLSLEEAFFLSFALGCFQVMDLTGKPLSISQIWRLFIESQSDFIENYVAYHYFRSKGWIVKSGIKFGGQFLLYKKGPSFYHASYIVLIENISEDAEVTRNKEGCLTWNKMNSLNRMAETCNKEILVCKIKWPTMSNAEKGNPLILKKFKVQEFLLRRWQPCHEKENGE